MQTDSIKYLRVIGLCALTIALTVTSAVAIATPASIVDAAGACDGLTCWDASDCGTKCFCNRPSSTCYLDSETEL